MSTNHFFWSHTLLKAVSGGYGRLYNWWCTQTRKGTVKYGYLYNWFCTQPQIKVKYGYLYNWFAATDSRNIANVGWHIPSQSEYQTLSDYLGGNSISVFKLQDTSNNYSNYTVGATNEVLFNLRCNGVRNTTFDIIFEAIKDGVYLLTSTVSSYLPEKRCLSLSSKINSFGPYFGFTSINNNGGFGIRLLKDSTTFTHGQTGTYIGNDGRVYKTICIGTQEWLSENLAETKYRNGSLIPKVTDNTAWAALTTGAMCAYNNDEANAFETASIAPVGFHVPTYAELSALATSLGGSSIAGGKMKEIGLNHWLTPNTGADNSSGFNGVGAGQRPSNFIDLKYANYLWSNAIYGSTTAYAFRLEYDKTTFLTPGGSYFYTGCSLRLIKNDSTFTPGDTVTDFDGNIYPLVKIGTQVWVASNWACTKYNDGTPIQNVRDNTQWSALTTGAMCAYNNDEANAFETASIAPVGFHVPTQTKIDLLQSYLGGWSVAGGKLKEIGLTHWLNPNMGATNDFGFNGLGSGVRDSRNGVFGFQKAVFSIHVSDIQIPGSYYGFTLEYNSASFLSHEPNNKYGRSLRLLKNDSTFTPGDTLTDIDGNIYPLVKIGTQVWTASNWKCTKYNDGTPIPNVTDNAAWAALTTGGQCIYNNDEANL